MPLFRLRKVYAFAATWPAKVEPDVLLANILSLFSGNLVRVVIGKELYSAPTKDNKFHFHVQVVFEQPRDVVSSELDGLGCGHGHYQHIQGDHNQHLCYITKGGMLTFWAPTDLATEALRALVQRLQDDFRSRHAHEDLFRMWLARDKRRERAEARGGDAFREYFRK